MQGSVADPANWPVEDDAKEEIVSMAASRVVMHQNCPPSRGGLLGYLLRRTGEARLARALCTLHSVDINLI